MDSRLIALRKEIDELAAGYVAKEKYDAMHAELIAERAISKELRDRLVQIQHITNGALWSGTEEDEEVFDAFPASEKEKEEEESEDNGPLPVRRKRGRPARFPGPDPALPPNAQRAGERLWPCRRSDATFDRRIPRRRRRFSELCATRN